jgi:hypothetical protein
VKPEKPSLVGSILPRAKRLIGKLAWYMWGASSDEDRNLMPNHAAQWAAIEAGIALW